MKTLGAFTAVTLLSLLVVLQPVFAEDTQAQEYEFTIIQGDDIENDPVSQKMLEKIELSWLRLIDLQQNKPILTEEQKLIEAQRLVVEQNLQAEIDSMYKEYEEFTPREAFSRYVEDKPEFLHGFYWELFNYLDQKVSIAKFHKDGYIASGGEYEDAMKIFNQLAKFPRAELVNVFEQARENHGIGGSFAGEIEDPEMYPTDALALYESWMNDPTMYKFVKIIDTSEEDES